MGIGKLRVVEIPTNAVRSKEHIEHVPKHNGHYTVKEQVEVCIRTCG